MGVLLVKHLARVGFNEQRGARVDVDILVGAGVQDPQQRDKQDKR